MTDDEARAAVVAALTRDQRRVIVQGARLWMPDLDGMDDAGEVLAVLRMRHAYDAEIGGVLTAHPDLARDLSAPWAILALLRTGHHMLTRENVAGLLARAREGRPSP